MHQTSLILAFALAVGACGGPTTPAVAPAPSAPSAPATADPTAASATPGAADSPAPSASAASAPSPGPSASAASASPPVTTKLTKAQFDDATQFVLSAYKKKAFDAVYKEMIGRFGQPVHKAPPLFGWYGADPSGKCFEFYVQKNNGEKWAGTGTLETDASNCSK